MLQLVYLQNNGFVESIYGSPELFLFDVDKIILNINLVAGQFTFVSKARLRADVTLTNDQFADAVLLSGCAFLRTFPPLESSSSHFMEAVAQIKRNRSVGAAISIHPDQTAYLEKFKKARAAVKHHVILSQDGKVEQMSPNDSPEDVHEFIGQRLPEELYFYLSRGAIGSQVLDMITTEQHIQLAPLDCNESEEYKRFLKALNDLQTQSLALLAKNLHRYWLTREVKIYSWFDPTHPKALVPKDIQPPPSEAVQKWNVPETIWGEEMDKQKVSVFDESWT